MILTTQYLEARIAEGHGFMCRNGACRCSIAEALAALEEVKAAERHIEACHTDLVELHHEIADMRAVEKKLK